MENKNKPIRLHVENLDQLYAGREFHNFIELCLFIGLTPPRPNNGKSVINRKRKIAKYFDFERIRDEQTGRLSHKIVITKLYYDPTTIYAENDKVEQEADE